MKIFFPYFLKRENLLLTTKPCTALCSCQYLHGFCSQLHVKCRTKILLLVAVDQLYFLLQSVSSYIRRLHCKMDEFTLAVISKNTACLFIKGHC